MIIKNEFEIVASFVKCYFNQPDAENKSIRAGAFKLADRGFRALKNDTGIRLGLGGISVGLRLESDLRVPVHLFMETCLQVAPSMACIEFSEQDCANSKITGPTCF